MASDITQKENVWRTVDKLDFGLGFVPVLTCAGCGAMTLDRKGFASDFCPGCGAHMRFPSEGTKEGAWIWDPNGQDYSIGSWVCSKCHTRPETTWQGMEQINPLNFSGSRFCPNCGAEMKKEKNENGD